MARARSRVAFDMVSSAWTDRYTPALYSSHAVGWAATPSCSACSVAMSTCGSSSRQRVQVDQRKAVQRAHGVGVEILVRGRLGQLRREQARPGGGQPVRDYLRRKEGAERQQLHGRWRLLRYPLEGQPEGSWHGRAVGQRLPLAEQALPAAAEQRKILAQFEACPLHVCGGLLEGER